VPKPFTWARAWDVDKALNSERGFRTSVIGTGRQLQFFAGGALFPGSRFPFSQVAIQSAFMDRLQFSVSRRQAHAMLALSDSARGQVWLVKPDSKAFRAPQTHDFKDNVFWMLIGIRLALLNFVPLQQGDKAL